MGAAFAKYNQELANETEAGGADAAGGGMNNASSIPQARERGAVNIPPPPKVIVPNIAPTPQLRGLAPEQTDIQDSFSTTNQYAARYGIAQQHF